MKTAFDFVAAGLPPDMNPEDAAAMTKRAMEDVKEALKDGTISKSEILELEKMMGSDIGTLSKMMKSVPKGALGSAAELSELADVFEKLNEIKKRG